MHVWMHLDVANCVIIYVVLLCSLMYFYVTYVTFDYLFALFFSIWYIMANKDFQNLSKLDTTLISRTN